MILKNNKDNRVLVVMESVRDDVKLLAEGIGATHKELRNFKNEMYEFRNEMYEFKDEAKANFKAVLDY